MILLLQLWVYVQTTHFVHVECTKKLTFKMEYVKKRNGGKDGF